MKIDQELRKIALIEHMRVERLILDDDVLTLSRWKAQDVIRLAQEFERLKEAGWKA